MEGGNCGLTSGIIPEFVLEEGIWDTKERTSQVRDLCPFSTEMQDPGQRSIIDFERINIFSGSVLPPTGGW
jgi:hypothetical protein